MTKIILSISKTQAFFNSLDIKLILISVGVSIILSLILLAIFKKNILTTLIGVFLICGTLIGSICYSFNKNYIDPELINDPIYNPTIEKLDPNDYLNIISNGGFDKSYVQQKENEENCPQSEDKFFDMNITEYSDSVIFYYDTIINGVKSTVNIIFIKNKDGNLIFDGCLNVCIKEVEVGKVLWVFPKVEYQFENKMYNNSNYCFKLNNSLTEYSGCVNSDPSFYTSIYQPLHGALLGVSRNQAIRYMSSISSSNKAIIYKKMQQGCINIYQDYFEQLGKIGILLNGENIFYQLNSFYNAVFKSVKELNAIECSVNVTHLTGDVQFDSETEEFIVYKSNRFLNIKYNNISSNAFKFSKNNENNKLINDNMYVDNTISVESVPKVIFKLYNNSTSLTGFDITKSPVTLDLIKDGTHYTYIFDTEEELNKGIECYLPLGNYSYEIDSRVLNFDGKYGTFEITNYMKVITLNFDYEFGTVECSVSLSPIDNVDLTGFDIATQPVTIRLSNSTQTFEFKFDTVEKLNGVIVQRLPIGTYEYRISSSGLSFSETYGIIDIDTLNSTLLFNYDYIAVKSSYKVEWSYKTNKDFFPNNNLDKLRYVKFIVINNTSKTIENVYAQISYETSENNWLSTSLAEITGNIFSFEFYNYRTNFLVKFKFENEEPIIFNYMTTYISASENDLLVYTLTIEEY